MDKVIEQVEAHKAAIISTTTGELVEEVIVKDVLEGNGYVLVVSNDFDKVLLRDVTGESDQVLGSTVKEILHELNGFDEAFSYFEDEQTTDFEKFL